MISQSLLSQIKRECAPADISNALFLCGLTSNQTQKFITFGVWVGVAFSLFGVTCNGEVVVKATPSHRVVFKTNKGINMKTNILRNVVTHQCRKFKAAYFHQHGIDPNKQWIFSEPDNRLIHFSEASVDHIIPFYILKREFLKEYGHLNTAQLKKAFKQFHKEHAQLRVISKTLNFQLSTQTAESFQGESLSVEG